MLGNNPQHSLLELVPTPGNMYVYSEERNSDFRVSSSVIKTVSIREQFKYPAVLIQIQPFLELKEPEILLNSPYFLESPNLNDIYIFPGVGTLRNSPPVQSRDTRWTDGWLCRSAVQIRSDQQQGQFRPTFFVI